MDVGKQVEYWLTSAREDFAAAESLLEEGHLRHSLFFAHLAVEKMLKAHVVHKTQDLPPRIHDLVRLARIGDVNVSQEQKDFLLEFGFYQLEGRYPDSRQMPLNTGFVKDELTRAAEILEWLTTRLPA